MNMCRVVTVADALRPESDPPDDPRPRVAITFDDAYRGAVTAGLAELRARGLPATIFVAPGVLGQSLWWDEYLSEDASARRVAALGPLAGRAERVRAHALRHAWQRVPVPKHAQAATAAELELVLRSDLITLGAHSWSHPVLPALDDADLAEELHRPLEWLRMRFAAAVLPLVAYPYGLANDRVERAAEAAGYVGGLRVAGGWLERSSTRRYRLPRLNVSRGLSDHGFVLRLSGIRAR
jgi:peptidoglycan/xylan/chitin deacetylase (PgdA/CDA1 family)